jgi:hypothetical protein
LSGAKKSSSDSVPAIRLTKRFIASPGASNVLQLAHDERGCTGAPAARKRAPTPG